MMAKYTNVVRFLVKEGCQAALEDKFAAADKWEGQLLHILARTGERTYVGYGLWESEAAMAAQTTDDRPAGCSRDLLEEISPELGVMTLSLGQLCLSAEAEDMAKAYLIARCVHDGMVLKPSNRCHTSDQ